MKMQFMETVQEGMIHTEHYRMGNHINVVIGRYEDDYEAEYYCDNMICYNDEEWFFERVEDMSPDKSLSFYTEKTHDHFRNLSVCNDCKKQLLDEYEEELDEMFMELRYRSPLRM